MVTNALSTGKLCSIAKTVDLLFKIAKYVVDNSLVG